MKTPVKKFKAPMELAGMPVFIIAEDLDQAKTIWAIKLVSVGALVNNSEMLDLAEVQFSEAAKTN